MIFKTASKVKERHELLLQTLGGSFDEEEHAYRLVTKLSWMLPIIIVCGGVLDMIVIFSYMRFAHPWKDILSGEKAPEDGLESKNVSAYYVIDNADFVTSEELQYHDKGQDDLSPNQKR